MQGRLRQAGGSKRVFGRDITNLERRGKVQSISEKTSTLPEHRKQSRSFQKKCHPEYKDPITEYQSQILSFMLTLQQKQKKELMINITNDMRQILVDWLVDVHQSFELKEQTLYLALAYLNEYASKNQITKHQYQLVGIACLWIASKYEEIYPPRMQNYVQVTDSCYSLSELKAMEGKIILSLKFNLNYTTPLQILEAVSDKWTRDHTGKLTKDALRCLNMCKYILELSLFQGLAQEYCYKTMVISAIMLSDSVLKTKSESRPLDSDRDSIMRCFKEMCQGLTNVCRPSLKLKAIKKKFNSEKYMGVAKFRIEPK